MMSIGSTAAGDDAADRSTLRQSSGSGSGQARVAKKARLDPSAAAGAGGADESRMEVDEDGEEVSDAETVPEEPAPCTLR